MSDLNDWELVVDEGRSLLFGTKASAYPFNVQVSMSEVASDTEDTPHPTSDGVVMGRDRLRGFTLQYDIRILRDEIPSSSPWHTSLDLYGAFVAEWRNAKLRLTPGMYASMANLNRNRLVYGRPRGIAPKFDSLRQGDVLFQADFVTNGPDFYDADERVALLTRAYPGGGTITDPITDPITDLVGDATPSQTINDGNLPAWPVIHFHGPGRGHAIDMFNEDGDVAWSIKVPDRLAFDDVLIVDTRPWSRSATINGRPANGLVFGNKLDQCTIPVGEFDIRYRVTNPTGTAFAVLRWRDTYASL